MSVKNYSCENYIECFGKKHILMNINSLSLQNKFLLTYVTQETDKIVWNI